MTINIKTDERSYYHRVINILHPIKPFFLLQPKEIQVLALMVYNDVQYEKEEIGKLERASLLVSYENKMKICDILKMSDVRYRNILTALRKKGFIDKDGLTAVTNVIRKPEDIIYKINIQGG